MSTLLRRAARYLDRWVDWLYREAEELDRYAVRKKFNR